MKMIDLTITEVDSITATLSDRRRTVRVDRLRAFLCGGHWFGFVPPRRVLNEFFLSGSTGGKEEGVDMIYEWGPFEINEHDYAGFIATLLALPGEPFKIDNSIPEEDWSHHALLRAMDELAG